MRDWGGHCQKCGKKTNCYMMSMYNEKLICMDCLDEESKRGDYEQARQADVDAIKNGNFNFKGVGL